jgi:hypothetical protein
MMTQIVISAAETSARRESNWVDVIEFEAREDGF